MKKYNNDLSQIKEILLSHPFLPQKFLQSPHIQTGFTRFIPYFTMPLGKPVRHFIAIPDGTKLIADCWFQKERDNHPTVIFLNGFEGYSKLEQSRFSKNMSMKAYYFGFNAIHLKQRGETDSIHLTKSLFTTYSGLNDIKIALTEFKKWGLNSLYLVGLSYGGYLTLQTLGRLDEKQHEYVRGMATIAAPLESFSTWEHVEENPFYNSWLLKSYKNIVKRRAVVDSLSKDEIRKLDSIKTKREFMETYMHKFGFPKKEFTFEEYVEATDIQSELFENNTIPLLLIASHDDPITPINAYLEKKIDYPSVITLFPHYGGHGGFITLQKKYGDLDAHWAQNRVIEFIRLVAANDKSLA
jgi:predicted alpha/beta-fold hydrolase